MIAVPMKVSANISVVPLNIGAAYCMGRDSPYEGPIEFTPTSEEQVIETAGKSVAENIIIHPIPSNYGLITYNGAFITVS